MTLKVKDIDRSMVVHGGILGFPGMLRLHHDDGSLVLIDLRATDTRYVEPFPDAAGDRASGSEAKGVHHFCLTVGRLEPVLEANGGTLFAWTRTPDGSELMPSVGRQISDGLDNNHQA